MFFHHCMITLLRQIKKLLVELMNRSSCFIKQSIDWYDGLDKNDESFFLFFHLFSGENYV